MDNRNYIINRLRSKKTSQEEFNFDRLQAPPLSFFLSPYDIMELHNIATSLRLSAKPEIRYQEIDKIMRRRGLVKFGAGTNRVVYRHPEFNNILFKIAADDVGLGDNPAEFKNQHLLKPFVTKCFEISPCGTVAIVERVNPITSREEYISVMDDVFELLTEWVIGRYIVADIGEKFFMNIGVRQGFGCVLLDYPYVYELDGNKLYCSKPDHNSPTGTCDGIIDYDDGYNFLHCTKCNAIYKAKELEKKISDKELIVKRKGDISMNIRVSGGTTNESSTINTGKEFTASTFKPATSSVKVTAGKLNVKTSNGDGVKVTKVEEKVNIPEINKSVNGVSTKAEAVARSPISFDEKYKEEAKANEVAHKSNEPIREIDDAVDKIFDMFDDIDIDSVRDAKIIAVIDLMMNALPYSVESIDILAAKIAELYRNTEDLDAAGIRGMVDIADLVYPRNDEAKEVFEEEEVEEVVEEETSGRYSGVAYYPAVRLKVNEISITDETIDVLVPLDSDGEYLVDKFNNIVAIDTVDNKTVQSVQLVSRAWIESIAQDNGDDDEEVEEEESEPEVIEAIEERKVLGERVGALPAGSEMTTAEFLANN